MAGVGGIGQGQTQQTEQLRHAEQTQRPDQVSAGAMSGATTVSFYEPGMQVKGADGRVVPIAAPNAGAAQAIAGMDTNELSAMLSGLRSTNEEVTSKASEEATLANKEKKQSIREQRIQELQKALEPPPKKKKNCAVAKIVLGSVLCACLNPAGAVVIAQGAKELKSYNSEMKAVGAERNQMMKQHFQQNHGQVKEFNKEYSQDYFDSDYEVKGGKRGNMTNQKAHIEKLEGMRDSGVINDQGFKELKALVEGNATPREMNEGFLNIAIAGKVDREAAGIQAENDAGGSWI